MIRVRRREEAEAVASVIGALPPAIQRRLEGVGLLSNYAPGFVGAHSYGATGDGRSYQNTSHVMWEAYDERPRVERRTTIVLLEDDAFDPAVVLHELGHTLDERLGFASFDPHTEQPRMQMKPLDWYAATQPCEAFATGFQSWATLQPTGRECFHDRDTLRRTDPALAAFFDRLAEAEAA